MINKKNETMNGITLIALIITIIILLILAGITLVGLFGENGLITKTKMTAFITEMKGIKENVELKKSQNAIDIVERSEFIPLFENKANIENEKIKIEATLKKEISYVKEGMPSDKTLNQYGEEDFDKYVDENGNLDNIYIIDEKTGNGKAMTYLYDATNDVVFKIPPTSIGGKIYHSYECLAVVSDPEEIPQDEIILTESDVVEVDGERYYAPNMKGFDSNDTELVYYSDDFSSTVNVPVEQYINDGQQYQIDYGNTKYTLHNYNKKIWANAKTTAHNQKAWWVWIPRYAYKVGENGTKSEPPIDVIYIDIHNKPLDPKYEGELPSDYIPHPAFTAGSTELKGIWMSKYEPSHIEQPSEENGLAPDMSGFNPENTYIELYDSETDTFIDEVQLAQADLNKINENKKWYDYPNKIWANIKTNANGQDAWWVWIPRYAYYIPDAGSDYNDINIIYIGLDNKPLNKTEYPNGLPEGYIVHPAFTAGSKQLKGIWMSKYEPSVQLYPTGVDGVLPPDMSGFDPEYTYIELYDSVTDTYIDEVKLADLSDEDLKTINENKEWYDYSNKIWANIKTNANGQDAWWVWIPRYAYRIDAAGTSNTMTQIIFVGLDDKPINKEVFPNGLSEGYIVHPGFNVEGKPLQGIWMSKYEPSEKK